MDRLVWVGALPRKDKADVRSIVSAALEAGFDRIVLAAPDPTLARLGRFSPIFLKDDAFLFDGEPIGRLAAIRSARDESAVRALRGTTKHVVVRTEDWKVIPLENLIAHFQGSGTRLLVEVHDAAEAKLFFETMEVGVDGVLLTTSRATACASTRAPCSAPAKACSWGTAPRGSSSSMPRRSNRDTSAPARSASTRAPCTRISTCPTARRSTSASCAPGTRSSRSIRRAARGP